MRPFSALILAGGRSSRMGQDKAGLMLNGHSMLDHMQQLALSAGAGQLLISRNQAGFVQDRIAGQGPLGGILSALPHCTADSLLVLPIDTPLLSPDALRSLLQQAADGAACFSGSPLPCVLPNNSELTLLLRQQLASGQRSVKALLQQLGAREVVTSQAELLNTNTPADWQQCLSWLATQRSHYAQT